MVNSTKSTNAKPKQTNLSRSIIKFLMALQQRDKKSNYEFAKDVGISREYWGMLLREERDFGMDTFEKFLAYSPEIKNILP